MIKGIRIALCGLLLAATSSDALAQKFELLEYGKMDNWVVRNIKESAVIGGKKKTIYAIGPNMTINNNNPYKNLNGNIRISLGFNFFLFISYRLYRLLTFLYSLP